METLTFLMTTTFYPPHHIGGDAVFVQYLAEELVKRGHEVHVMTGMDAYLLKKRRRLKEYIQDSGVTVHDLKSPYGIISPLSAHIFGSSRYYTYRFSELVHKLKPDIVHHHNVSLLGHSLLRKQGAHFSIHTTHDFWLICPTYGLVTNKGELCARKRCVLCTLSQRRFPQFWRYTDAFKKDVHGPDLIISPSEFFRRIQEEALQRRIVHIPNFVPYPPKTKSHTDFSNFFLYAGRLERGQGVSTLLSVFGSENTNSKLVVVGTGSLSGYVAKFVERKGLQNKITYLGFVSNMELHRLYKAALATINPSEYLATNFPLVALESLSNGTPVIASNKGGLPEIVEKVDPSLVYNSNDELRRILLDFNRSKYPSDMIKAIYEENYTPSAFLRRYFDLINCDRSVTSSNRD